MLEGANATPIGFEPTGIVATTQLTPSQGLKKTEVVPAEFNAGLVELLFICPNVGPKNVKGARSVIIDREETIRMSRNLL